MILAKPQSFYSTQPLVIHVFHLVTNYHGRTWNGRFMLDIIREAHRAFVETGRRDQVTLLGSGGIIAAEHIAKAIVCGLDAIAEENDRLFGIPAGMLLETDGRRLPPHQVYRKIHPRPIQALQAEEAWVKMHP